MVGIIDSKICNIESICNLIRKLGFPYKIVDSQEMFDGINRLILPGVGAFARAMENLEQHKLLDGILAHAAAGKPTTKSDVRAEAAISWTLLAVLSFRKRAFNSFSAFITVHLLRQSPP